MVRFLFTITLLAVFGSHAAVLGSSTSILTSMSPSLAIYSCFLLSDVEIGSEKEACCKSVVEVLQGQIQDETTLSSIELRERCMLEMAQIPTSTSFFQEDTAKYSWAVSRSPAVSTNQAAVEQYLWTISGGGDTFQEDLVKTATPYHKTSNNSPSIVPSEIDSHLGRDGGMHRLFHHKFQVSETADTYFLYVTVPTGMFIDLDDPIEATTGMLQSDGQTFVVTTDKSSVRARLHAATVCDIEQPSFVSGQHLLVWEIDEIVGESSVEFATKLHLRYPHPSANLEQWIDLPSPLLFANTNHSKDSRDWSLGFAERVWVAAGSDEDHDWIMGMTISFCLIGVGIMLRDVSRASLWDDV